MQVVNSNYNGDLLEFLYQVVSVGNQVLNKGIANFLTDVAKKRALPKLSMTDDPLGAYTTGAPTSQTVTTSYSEREIEPEPMMLYEEFLPEDFLDVWDKWQPVGEFTDLRLNPEFLADVISLYENKIGTQLSKLFWQGDKSLPSTNPLHFFDGILVRAAADPNVIDVTNVGVITKTNVVDIVASVWSAIPDKFLDDSLFKIHMNTTDYKLLQEANNDAKKTTVGVLDENIKSLFLNKRIEHIQGLPKNSIVGAKGMIGDNTSNLWMAFYTSIDRENPRINHKDNSGKVKFVRWDLKADANYREGSEIVLYQGS